MDYKVEDKPKVEDKKADEKDTSPGAGEQKIPLADLDPIQVEAYANHTRDAYSKPLDREEVLENVKKRREEREKWEEDQKKKSEKAAKSDK